MSNQNSPEYIRRMQQTLNRKLGLQIPVDGVMGFHTRKAIRNFHQHRGLPIEKFIDTEHESASSPEILGKQNYEMYENAVCPSFTPVAVENPGGGRIKNKTIPKTTDIVTIQGAFGKTPLHRLTAEALKALVCAARADGIKHPLLLPTGSISGFRSPKYQAGAWERAKKHYGEKDAGKWVGRPGLSAHQTGRAIDFYLGMLNRSSNVLKLRHTSAYKWMVANASRFGFYPYQAEPWHWEYNPPAYLQHEFFSEINESFEYENFNNDDESFEDEYEFADETEDWEYESALDVLSPTELKAVRITSTFETGRPGSFGGLTGNFDGQGLSFGLLNFTIKAGSLIPLLQEFINNFPTRYSAIFGKDAQRFKDMVFATKPDPKNQKRRIRDVERQMEFVNKQMNSIPIKAKSNKIIEPWKTYFGGLENDSEFRKIQVKAVRKALERARYWFNYFGFKTERGFAFMFDLVSSHGGAWLNAPKFKGKRRTLLQQMLAIKKAKLNRDLTELEKMEAIANMIADISLPEWREKARIRKKWFVRGSGKVHGSFFDIRKNFGITDNPPNFGKPSVASEFEWESYYDNEFEFEQPTITPTPTLLGTPEKNSYGETFYVKIGIGKGLPASTGIYVPNSFKPNSDVVVVIYLHGHKSSYPGNKVLINGYWDDTRFPFFALREEVAASGKNVIFVAPSLGPLSQAGTLIEKGGFDVYIKNVLSAMNNHYLMPRNLRPLSDIRTIILSAHSGGGSPMLHIARGADQYAKRIRECWGFDSMYGAVAAAWVAWAKSHPNQTLYAYYGSAKGYYDQKHKRYRVFPRDNGELIACEAVRQQLTNLCIQPSRSKTINKIHAHFWVPKDHLKERLLNSPCTSGYVCPKQKTVK